MRRSSYRRDHLHARHIGFLPQSPAIAARTRALDRLLDRLADRAGARLRQSTRRSRPRRRRRSRHRSPVGVRLRNADQLDLRVGEQLALVGRSRARPMTMPAKLSRRRSATVRACGVDQQRAVLVEPRRPAPRRSTPARRARAAPGRRCGTGRPADAGVARERGVLGQMQRLAVHRHRDLRPHPAVELAPSRRGADGRRRAPDACGR